MKTKTQTPALYIREQIFGLKTQEEFADLLGYRQASISRFEAGEPFSKAAQQRIIEAARERGIHWDNNWFFEVPPNRTTKQGIQPAA